MISYITLAIIGACWGSVLNMIAWRLLSGQSLWYYRSYCPTCHTHIRWYDLIPILSWIILRGTCRTCHASISSLYPTIEALTAIIAVASVTALSPHTLIWFWPYASTLIITIHTDIRAYQISSWMTLWLIPGTISAAWYGITPVGWEESLISAGILYTLFAGINSVFWYTKGEHTLGQGDWELMAYIASVMGCAASAHIMLGGSIISLVYALFMPQANTHTQKIVLPFGAGIACAALIYPFIMQQ